VKVTCQHCDTHYFSRPRTRNLQIVGPTRYQYSATEPTKKGKVCDLPTFLQQKVNRSRWSQRTIDVYGCCCRRYVEVGDYFKKLYIVDIVRTDAGEYKCVLDASVPLEKSTTLIIYRTSISSYTDVY